MHDVVKKLIARPALAAAILTFIVSAIPLALGLVPLGTDFSRVDVPMMCELRDALARGARLWLSRHMGNGGPFFANPHAQLLYPLRWLGVVLGPEMGAAFIALLHLVIAASGAAFLMRTFGVSRTVATLLGVTYACSGNMLNLISHASYLVGGAWLPLAWASARVLLLPTWNASREREKRHALLLCVALAAMMLGGEPQSVSFAAFLVGADVITALWKRRGRAVRATAMVLSTSVSAVFIGGLLWIPALAELTLGDRGGRLDTKTAMLQSFTVDLWPTLLVPGLGIAQGRDLVSYLAVNGESVPFLWNVTPFFGVLPLLALPIALLIQRARVPVLLGAFFFLLSAGSVFPRLFAVMTTLFPPILLFRYAAKHVVPFTLVALVVTGLVLTHARRRAAVRRVLRVGFVLVVGVLLVFLVATLIGREALDEIAGPAAHVGGPERFLPLYGSVLQRLLLVALIGPLFSSIALSWSKVNERRHLAIVLSSILLLEVGLAAPYAVRFTPAVLDDESPLDLLAIARDEPTIYCLDKRGQMSFAFDDDTWDTNTFVRTQFRWGESEMQACFGLTSPIEYAPSQTRVASLIDSIDAPFAAGRARAFGCDRLVTPLSRETEGLREVPWRTWLDIDLPSLEGMRVLEVEQPIPLVFSSPNPVVIPHEENLVRALMRGADPTRVIDDPLGVLTTMPTGTPAVRNLSLTRIDIDDVVITFEGEGNGIVGVRQSFRVGFSASQAGRALPVVRVGGMFLGVVVDDLSAGPVTLRYRPPRLGMGLASGASGALLFMVTLLLTRDRRTRAREKRS